MDRNPISSGQNKNLMQLPNSNRGIVIINKWSQNLIFTTKIVKNGCFGIVGPETAKTSIFYYFSGQNQNLRPLLSSNYTPNY